MKKKEEEERKKKMKSGNKNSPRLRRIKKAHNDSIFCFMTTKL